MTSQGPGLQLGQDTLGAWLSGFREHNRTYQEFVEVCLMNRHCLFQALANEVLALRETNKRLDVENKNLLKDRQRFEKQLSLLDNDLV